LATRIGWTRPAIYCLFIDTNLFSTFYHLASEDIKDLRKMIVPLRKN
jgi:hypothetical protein